MLKVRLMGTKNDIKWFGKILQRNPKVEVTEFSEMYPNKGTKKFYSFSCESPSSVRASRTAMARICFTVMIFFVIHIICGTENDVVVNVTFINMSGNDIRKFPL